MVTPTVVDRVAARVVADRIAARIACLAGLREHPEVSIGGMPFLTQLNRQSFEQVSATAHGVAVGKYQLTRVAASAKQVRVSDSGPIRVAALTGSLTVGYGQLSAFGGGAKLSADDTGQLVVEATAPILGRKMPVTVYARAQLVGSTLTIRPTEVEVPGIGIRLSAEKLPDSLAGPKTVNLPDLPAGLTYRSATATREGLRIDLTGSDISTSASGGGNRKCGGKTR